jgi:DNA-binding CsgD family transcriptional regulator
VAVTSPAPPGADIELLERELEHATIDSLLQRARSGRGGRLVLDGPAGIGKTALLTATCARAADSGWRVFAAEATEVASQLAFGVARALLGAEWPTESAVRPDGSGDRDGRSDLLQRAVRTVLELAGSQRLLLAVDDVQWADGASLRWLAALAQRLGTVPIALVVAVRSGEDRDRPPALAEVLDDHRALVVRPAPLSEAAAAQLLAGRLGRRPTPELAAVCYADCAGNPFLLRTLADGLRQAGVLTDDPEPEPERLREIGSRALARTVAGRLARMDATARALIEGVAVAGDVGAPRELAAMIGLDPGRAEDAARRLADADLLRSSMTTELSHPLVREAILGQLGSERREALRRTVGESLVAVGRLEEGAARLADLRPAADPAIVEALAAAAGEATARGAPDVASALLRRALEEPPTTDRRGELLEALGLSLLSLGDDAAIPVLEQALTGSPAGDREAALTQALGLALEHANRAREATELFERAASRLRPADPAAAELLEAHALHSMYHDPALHARRERRLAELGDDPGVSPLAHRMRLAEQAVSSLTRPGPAQATIALAERALAGGWLLSSAVECHATATLALAYAGRPREARVHLHELIERARRSGHVAVLALALGLQGETRRLEGDVIAVETDVRTAIELTSGDGIGPPFMIGSLLASLLEQDEVEIAEAELRRAGLTGTLPEAMPSSSLLLVRGRVRIASGALRLGLDDLLLAGEHAERHGMHDPGSVPWRAAAAEALLALGEHEQARVLADEQLELARRMGAVHAVGAALRVHGVVLGGAAGRGELAEAAAMLERSFARLELAHALLDQGASLTAVDASEARRVLIRATALAEELGARAVARRGGQLLVAAGGRPRRAARRGIRGLTPAERRVARLASEGLTNRAIAETLVVTEKTIESHLASAYGKLAISGRGELAAALAAGADGSSANRG